MPQVLAKPANQAYGASAADWAQRLPASLPIVTSDLESVPFAFADAAVRRKGGDRFAAAAFIDDPRARYALFLAGPPILAQITDYDERAALLDAVALGGLVLDGRKQRDVECYDSRFLRSAHEFLVTGDVVIMRSSVEHERVCLLVGRRFLETVTLAPLDGSVPGPPALPRPGGQAIVVWAPRYPAEACGILAFALEQFRRPVIVVCAPGQPAVMRAGTRFVSVSEGGAALAQAAVIVDASLSDPGVARALALWRIPLAAASSAGALEWLDGITTFDPWNHRSISAAVSNALGYGAPRERASFDEIDELRKALTSAEPAPCVDGPLVSVIVPTMNGRDSLKTALESIDLQTYAHLEIVLVNDGGPPINCAALGTSRAVRLIEYVENRGVSAAVNAGIAAAEGIYVAILADDDLFCRDHLTQLVGALERTGGHFAHALELCEHLEQQLDGTFSVIGHSIIAGEPAMPTRLQTGNDIGGPAVLFTREAFERVGPFDECAGHLMDFEMWMRMSMAFDLIHVDRVTAIMTMRNDNSQASAVSGAQTAALYSSIYDLHPTSRRMIAEAREWQLRQVEAIQTVRALPQIRIAPRNG